MCICTGFAIVWQSGYFQLGMRNLYFFCVNIHVSEKAVCKSCYISYQDSICSQSELCLELLDIVSVRSLLMDC
jgi:hypothetical protein